MDTTLADQAFSLRRRLEIWANDYYFLPDTKDRATELPPSLKDAFFSFISHLSLTLMEDEDNFFGYFFFQMGKELDLALRAPTGVTFRGTKYILFFQPFLFLEQTPEQMLSSIRHEILHIVFRHLLRARDLRGSYSKLALNLAMDAIVNTYLDPVPADGVTIERINGQYQLYLTPYDTLENYAEQIQRGIDWKKKSNTTTTDQVTDSDKPQFDPAHAHDLWERADAADPQTMVKFTEKYLDDADKGGLPSHLSSAIRHKKRKSGPALGLVSAPYGRHAVMRYQTHDSPPQPTPAVPSRPAGRTPSLQSPHPRRPRRERQHQRWRIPSGHGRSIAYRSDPARGNHCHRM